MPEPRAGRVTRDQPGGGGPGCLVVGAFGCAVLGLVSLVSGDFESALQFLARREVVRELTAAGMSTRAIAPIVGVGKSTIDRDAQQVSSP